MTQPTGEGPQDAPQGQPWPAWPQAGASPAPGPPQPGAAAGEQVPGAAPGSGRVPDRAHPASAGPCGPNWVLAAIGAFLLLAAGGLLAHLLGYRPDGGLRVGPQALIAAGAVLLVVGAVGLVGRRTGSATRRRRRATTLR